MSEGYCIFSVDANGLEAKAVLVEEEGYCVTAVNQCREREIPTESTYRMSPRHLMLSVGYAMVLASSFTLTGCKQAPGTKSSSPVPVEAASVVPKPIRLSDEFNGRVASINSVEVRARVTGYVDIGSIVTVAPTYGPDPVMRYNGYPAADLIGDSDPKVLSSGQVVAKLTEIANKVLPRGIVLEWTDLSYQQVTQSHAAAVVFPLAVMLAFLVLSALYESWTLPLAVILIVPVCMCAALLGVRLTGGDNNVFVQVGLVVLMGLACKNAILIVEFARELEIQGTLARNLAQLSATRNLTKSTVKRLQLLHYAPGKSILDRSTNCHIIASMPRREGCNGRFHEELLRAFRDPVRGSPGRVTMAGLPLPPMRHDLRQGGISHLQPQRFGNAHACLRRLADPSRGGPNIPGRLSLLRSGEAKSHAQPSRWSYRG